MTATAPRSFSNMQWYFSHAGNTVHFVAFCRHPVSAEDFSEMVRSCVRQAPEIAMAVDVANDCHARLPEIEAALLRDPLATPLARYEVTDKLAPDPPPYFGPGAELFARSDLPAFRATCQVVRTPQPGEPACVIHFIASHGLIEGADLASVLRGKKGRHDTVAQDDARKSRLRQAFLSLAAPPLALLYLALSWSARRKPADFGFVAARFEVDELRALAKRLAVSKRALLFGLVLLAFRSGNGRQRFAYTHLPRRQIPLEDDGYMTLRMQLMAYRGPENFTSFVQGLDKALQRQNETEILTQLLYNRILGVQRWLRARWPAPYTHGFFGYAPFDLVLSLLPPLRPGPGYRALSDAVLFGGSYTATTPNVIFLWGPEQVTLTGWLLRSQHAGLDALAAIARENGISVACWR
jgi:hypothetical protein